MLLFVGSGAAALIYEVVWQQLLQLVIGSSTVSLGVLLGTFMGGMCLGSLFAPRLISAAITRSMFTPLSRAQSACWGSRCCSRCRWSRGSTWRSAAMVPRVSWSGRSSRASAFCRRPLRWAPRCRRSAGGSSVSPRSGVARAVLRGQSRGCGPRMSACRVLPASRLRHGRRHVRRRGDQPVRRWRRLVRGAWRVGRCNR